MSSRNYSESGIGCYTYELKPTKKSFLKLIHQAKLENELKKFVTFCLEIKDDKYDEKKLEVSGGGFISYNGISLDDYDDYFDTGYCGRCAVYEFLAMAISKEIEEKTNEQDSVVYVPSSEDDTDAVLYQLSGPWYYLSNNIKLMSYDKYESIFNKYANILVEDSKNQLFHFVDVSIYG